MRPGGQAELGGVRAAATLAKLNVAAEFGLQTARAAGLNSRSTIRQSDARLLHRHDMLLRRPMSPRELLTTDIRGQMILLGTGTSVGVPVIGCGCDVCTQRQSAEQAHAVQRDPGAAGGNLLIDTSPDVREQLLREQIGIVHAVLYTHEHADHVFGLDDLRMMQFYLGGPVPLYCEPHVEDRIRKSFDYAFYERRADASGRGAAAGVSADRPGAVRGAGRAGRADPPAARQAVRRARLSLRQRGLLHRHQRDSAGELERLQGLDVLILDALRPRGHATHFSLEEAVEVARELAAAANVLHAHVARAGARGDERGAAGGDGAGLRRAADCADVSRVAHRLERIRKSARRKSCALRMLCQDRPASRSSQRRYSACAATGCGSGGLRRAAVGGPTAILLPPSRSR